MATGLSIDAKGDIVLTGNGSYNIDFGGGPLSCVNGNGDTFIAKLDSAGTHLSSTCFSNGGGMGRALADADGNFLVKGFFGGTSIDLGSGPIQSTGQGDFYIAKFGPSWSPLWTRTFAVSDYGGPIGSFIGVEGNVLLVGDLVGVLTFNEGTFQSAGGNDVFIAKFDGMGNHLWSHRFGDAYDQHVGGVAIDAAGNILIAGSFEGTLNFNGESLSSGGGSDFFWAEFDASGKFLWSKRLGDAGNQPGTRVAMNALATTVVAGTFDGTVDFGGEPLTSEGSSDIFFAKLCP